MSAAIVLGAVMAGACGGGGGSGASGSGGAGGASSASQSGSVTSGSATTTSSQASSGATSSSSVASSSSSAASSSSSSGGVCDAGAAEVSVDCTQGSAACSQIQIPGDPAPPNAAQFYGYLDPALRRDPSNGSTLFLTYSYPLVDMTPPSTGTIETHLAKSTDGGGTWSYVGPIWAHAKASDGNITSHEVSSLAASGTGRWFAMSHDYEVPPGGALYTEPLFTQSSTFVLAAANAPAGLASSTDTAVLNFGGTTITPDPSAPNLTTIAGDAACVTWREPALIVQNGVLYMAAQCATANGDFTYIGIFAAPIGGQLASFTWHYLGKLFKASDAAQFLPPATQPVFTEIDLSAKPNGGVVAIMTVMDLGNQQKYGSRTADVATLGTIQPPTAPAMVRDCNGQLIPTGQFTASDLNTPPNQGPGASTYDAAGTPLGVLIVRRDVTPHVHGFTFSTGLQPQ